MASPAPSYDSSIISGILDEQTVSPTVTVMDGKGRSQPWRDIVPNRYWAEARSFSHAANKGPRADIRILPEIDAISR